MQSNPAKITVPWQVKDDGVFRVAVRFSQRMRGKSFPTDEDIEEAMYFFGVSAYRILLKDEKRYANKVKSKKDLALKVKILIFKGADKMFYVPEYGAKIYGGFPSDAKLVMVIDSIR